VLLEMPSWETNLLNEFVIDADRIQLYWSLIQIESCANSLKPTIKHLIESVNVKTLSDDTF
jgi:hypothetical protein